MAGHSSLPSTSTTVSDTENTARSSTRTLFDSTRLLKSPSRVHLPHRQSRHVDRDLFEMIDMEEGGRFREIRFSVGGGEDFRDVTLSPIRLQSPTMEDPQAPEYLSAPRVSKATLAWRYFLGVLCTIYTVGLCHFYFEKFRRRPSEGRDSILGMQRTSVVFDSTHAQWLKVVRKMSGIWRLARVGCGLLLPLSVALLQIDGVVTTVLAKTCTISTAIFAGTGLISSATYLFCRRQLSSSQNREKWKQASEGPNGLTTAVFWTCLALPLTTLIWSIMSCAISVVCIAWTKHSDVIVEERTSFISSAVFITLLSVISIIYVCKAAGMVLFVTEDFAREDF